MTRYARYGAYLCLFFLLGLPACRKESGRSESAPSDEMLVFDVVEVETDTVERYVEGFGSLAPYRKATVVSRVDGVVEEVCAKKGDSVGEGSALFVLSNYQLELQKLKVTEEVTTAEEELETASLQLQDDEKAIYRRFIQLEKMKLQMENLQREIEFMEAHLGRKEKLYEKGGMTGEELRNLRFSLGSRQGDLAVLQKEYELQSYGLRTCDLIEAGCTVPDDPAAVTNLLVFINTRTARKRVEFAEIRLSTARLELDRVEWLIDQCTVRSPIMGVAADLLKQRGEKVSADEAVATVFGNERLVSRVAFPEKYRLLLKEGMKAAVEVEALAVNMEGTIYSVDPYVDVQTRQFLIDCIVDGENGLVPGMFVRVRVPVEKRERLPVIPSGALFMESDNQGYVYVVSDGRIFKRSISFEEHDGRTVAVTRGLEKDEIIVRNPLMNLAEGMKIKTRK